jgi:hypothetical protein
VFAIQSDAGVPAVVELTQIEWPQLGVCTGMLDMARHAIGRHGAVHAGPAGDAFGDGRMAREALRCGDLLAGAVTREAMRHALELLVRAIQLPGRDKSPELRRRRLCRQHHSHREERHS